MDRATELVQALAVTAEITGSNLSDAAASVMARDLMGYPHAQILAALSRCRRELRTRLTLAEVLARIDDGRPGPQEAWAAIPQDEAGSVVWSDEMAQAWGKTRHAENKAAQKAAFCEVYARLVSDARANGKAPNWTPSLGHDSRTREAAITEAVTLGRLTAEHAMDLLPYRAPGELLQLAGAAVKRIGGKA
jgi:hypothetical protein